MAVLVKIIVICSAACMIQWHLGAGSWNLYVRVTIPICEELEQIFFVDNLQADAVWDFIHILIINNLY